MLLCSASRLTLGIHQHCPRPRQITRDLRPKLDLVHQQSSRGRGVIVHISKRFSLQAFQSPQGVYFSESGGDQENMQIKVTFLAVFWGVLKAFLRIYSGKVDFMSSISSHISRNSDRNLLKLGKNLYYGWGIMLKLKKKIKKKIRGFTWRKIGKKRQFLPKFDIFSHFKLHKTYKILSNVDEVTDIS